MSNNNTIKELEIITIVLSTISMLFSLSVVILLLLRYKKFVSGKLLMHSVLFIAICDTIVSFSYSLGYPTNDILCSFQGFISINFERASWFYTDLLILNIYGAIVNQKYIIKNYKIMHILIWFIIIILAFVPFINNVVYGNDSSKGQLRCGFSNNNNDNNIKSVEIWNRIQDISCLISIFSIVIVSIRIYIYIYFSNNNDNNDNNNIFKKKWGMDALYTLLLYPIVMTICWLPSQVYGVLINLSKSKSYIIDDATHIPAPLYGLLLSLIIYIKIPDTINEWKDIIFNNNNNNDDSNSNSNDDDAYNFELRESDTTINTLVIRLTE